MATKLHKSWVLWGQCPEGWAGVARSLPLKITGGSLPHCRGQLGARKQEGWRHLVVMPEGKRPVSLP